MVVLIVIGVVLLITPLLCFAQTSSIEVRSTTDDPVGQRLVFANKERIRASTSMVVTTDTGKPRIVLSIVTLDPARSDSGLSTVYAVTWVYDSLKVPHIGLYLSQQVGACGLTRIQSCADRIVAATDEQIEIVRGKGFPLQ